MAKILDGIEVANSIYTDIKNTLAQAKQAGYQGAPKLVIIMVGNNPASTIYVKQKIKTCQKLGFECLLLHWQEEEIASTKALLDILGKYNQDKTINGILVQLPLPAYLDKFAIINKIAPEKDVDGLHPINIGKTFLGREFEFLTPCTASGVIKMLEYYQIEVSGKKITVIGSGIIAGKPIAMMLSNRRATVTICNSKTAKLIDYTAQADLVIVATGVMNLIKKNMVKKSAIIIDVGISKDAQGKLHGDVDFSAVSKKVAMISPVPGGVGKLTVACLMENLVKAALSQNKTN